MQFHWDPEPLLQSIGTELDKITIKGIQREDESTVVCTVETGFLGECFGDEEEEYELYLRWDNEICLFSITFYLLTTIPADSYGWAIDQLNLMSADDTWCLQGRIECPEFDDDVQTLVLVGTWRLVVPPNLIPDSAGWHALGPIIRPMLQCTCIDTVVMASQLMTEYDELKVM